MNTCRVGQETLAFGYLLCPHIANSPIICSNIVLPTLEQRQAMIEYLNEREINSVFHYLPLHLSEMGQRFGGREGDCPVTENVSDRLLRLPFS